MATLGVLINGDLRPKAYLYKNRTYIITFALCLTTVPCKFEQEYIY